MEKFLCCRLRGVAICHFTPPGFVVIFCIAGAQIRLIPTSVATTRAALIQLFESDWSIGSWNLTELLMFGLIGLFGGLLGGAFVQLLSWVFRLARVSRRLQTWWGHVLRGLFVALLISIVAYPFPFMRVRHSALFFNHSSPS